MWRDRLWEISSRPLLGRALYVTAAALLSWLHLFIHAAKLDHPEFILDEAGTWGVARRSLGTLLTLPTEFHSQPPLYYFVLHFWMQLGSSPWSLRFLSWLCCLLILQFILFYLHELHLGARVFLCLLFIFSDLTHFLATTARPYAMAAFLTLVASVALVRLAEAPSRRRAIGYALSALAMGYTMAFEVAALLAHGLFAGAVVIVDAGKQGVRAALLRHRQLLLAMAAVVAGYLPYLGMAIHYQYKTNTVRAWDTIVSLGTYTGAVRQHFKLAAEPGMVGLWFLAAMALVGQRSRRVALYPIITVVSIAFVHFFMTGRGGVGVQFKYMTPAFVAMCLLAGYGFQQLAPRVGPAVWWVLPLLLAYLAWPRWQDFHLTWGLPRPVGNFELLYKEMARQPGRKLIFFDVGYSGQHLEYEARDDASISVATMPGPGWARGGSARIEPGYVSQTVASNAPTTRCFYYFQEFPDGAYASAFLPAMQRLGYRPLPPLQIIRFPVHGYCRP